MREEPITYIPMFIRLDTTTITYYDYNYYNYPYDHYSYCRQSSVWDGTARSNAWCNLAAYSPKARRLMRAIG